MKEKEPIELREQIRFIGNQVEAKVKDGADTFLGQPERMWIKGMLERKGFELGKIEGKANLSEQAMAVVEVLGRVRTVEMVKAVILEMLGDNGNVFGKGLVGDPENVGKFVEKFLNKYIGRATFVFDPKKYEGDGSPGSNWRMNTVMRIEAVLSVANKLMWVMGHEDEKEGRRRQETVGVSKHLRERVLRGLSRAGEEIGPQVHREDLDKVIRFLPKGGLAIILEQLALD